MNPLFDHKFLEQYLSGKMSPVEKGAFEMRLENEPVLRAELAAMKRERGIPDDLPEQEIPEAEETGGDQLPKKLAFIILLIVILLTIMYFIAKG